MAPVPQLSARSTQRGGVTGRTDTPPSGGLKAQAKWRGGRDAVPEGRGDVQAQSAPAVSVAVELPIR